MISPLSDNMMISPLSDNMISSISDYMISSLSDNLISSLSDNMTRLGLKCQTSAFPLSIPKILGLVLST